MPRARASSTSFERPTSRRQSVRSCVQARVARWKDVPLQKNLFSSGPWPMEGAPRYVSPPARTASLLPRAPAHLTAPRATGRAD